jgi:hypothetical protein
VSRAYYHCLVVKDLSWRPKKASAEALHQVLVKWKLVTEKPRLYRIHEGLSLEHDPEEIKGTGEIPENLILTHDSGRDQKPLLIGSQVGEILGPAEDGSLETSLCCINVVLGCDFKITMNENHGAFQVAHPACEGAREIAPVAVYPLPDRRSKRPESHPHFPSHQVFPASWTAKPPAIKWSEIHHLTGAKVAANKSRLWRSGVVLDCGGDYPEFVSDESKPMRAPCRRFVRDLQDALSTDLAEFGLLG